MGIKDIKLGFLSFFREFFVHHHRSLEFRAKLFAAIIAADKKQDESVYEILQKIGQEIYGNDENRVQMLIRTTKEYVEKVVTDNDLDLDELIKELDRSLKNNKRYIDKINMNHLGRLKNSDDEEVMLTQQRIIEFAESEIYFKTQTSLTSL